MTETDMLQAIRNRFTDAYPLPVTKEHIEQKIASSMKNRLLVIVHKVGRTIAEFSPEDGKRMNELVMTYGVTS